METPQDPRLETPSPPSEPTATAPAMATGRRSRPAWIGYLGVGLIGLLVGGGTMWAVARFQAGPITQPTAPTTAAAAAVDDMSGMPGMSADAHAADKDTGSVYVSPARQQLIGVRTMELTHQALDGTIRTVGTIAYDETRVTQIHTKVAGWIEHLSVDYVGKLVRRGQPLFTLYSPDLVATQREYLLALKGRTQLAASQFAETRTGAESLVAATRERLRLWDVSDAQISELERTGEPRKTLTLYSPFTGIVLERNAFAGQYITPEVNTFTIADLSTVWVIGQVFEYELRAIRLGQTAEIEFPYQQSTRHLSGRVTFIYPDIDPQTRRARVRIEFRNPGLELKPQTYVTVVIRTPGGHQLAIPKEAVIDTGAKRYAILAHPNGYFEPRDVQLGEPVGDFFPVMSGLAQGDRVVTSAQFLVDSETNLQAAMQAMSMSMPGMDMGSGNKKDTPGAEPPSKPAAPAPPPPNHEQHKPQ